MKLKKIASNPMGSLRRFPTPHSRKGIPAFGNRKLRAFGTSNFSNSDVIICTQLDCDCSFDVFPPNLESLATPLVRRPLLCIHDCIYVSMHVSNNWTSINL